VTTASSRLAQRSLFLRHEGALNNLQFTGDDYFADKDVCSIVLEVPNSALVLKRWAYGFARWTAQAGNGFRRIAVRGQIKLHSLPASRTPPISLRSRRTMPVSSRLRARAGAHRWIYAGGSNAGGRDPAAGRPPL
jgi:hypothetical protein